MKKYLIFITILLSNFGKIYSCGYSPYGEDIRYSFFLPEYFNYQDFSAFYYNADLFGFDYEYQNQYESNVYDWFNFTNQKVPIDDINECLNRLKRSDINSSSRNQFVKYLFDNKLNDVIQYLIVAKRCEDFNHFESYTSWERNDEFRLDYVQFLDKLSKKIDAEKSDYLKRKYAFLTIRTAYYGGKLTLIKTLFDKYFSKGEEDYLYYWALYFNSFDNKDASIDIANIMAYSAEKKYACYYYFHKQFNLEDGLSKAMTSSDIANLYAYASVQRLEPNLDYLKQIYKNSNKLKILDFLLLREINKIEDWVYTPYYINFLPSTKSDDYDYGRISTEILRARSEKDRLYAQQVLDFIRTVDYSKIKDVLLWKAAEIQLLFITRSYDLCLNKIKVFEKEYGNDKVFAQIEKIKALCIISNQKAGKAIIKKEAQPIILKYLDDDHFIFSIGRELEFRNNLPDALALIAYGNKKREYSVEWQGNRLKKSGYLEYFYDYFDYLDFVYSEDELQIVVDKLNTKIEDDLDKTIYRQLLKDKNYLIDLLGTKYMRINKLTEAERIFVSLGDKYWDENYNSWERDKYNDYYTFDKNPFYDINYTYSFVPREDKFVVTKLSVTQHLIKYLALANNPKTPDRDYYYFVVGNCYFNMTYRGHSWMMRRFYSSSYYDEIRESFIDEIEYRNANLAQKYYRLAAENSKTDKFKALCIRMELYAKYGWNTDFFKFLKSSNPKYYDDLSNCENLENYFKARR